VLKKKIRTKNPGIYSRFRFLKQQGQTVEKKGNELYYIHLNACCNAKPFYSKDILVHCYKYSHLNFDVKTGGFLNGKIRGIVPYGIH
jgi:hypothetical protein